MSMKNTINNNDEKKKQRDEIEREEDLRKKKEEERLAKEKEDLDFLYAQQIKVNVVKQETVEDFKLMASKALEEYVRLKKALDEAKAGGTRIIDRDTLSERYKITTGFLKHDRKKPLGDINIDVVKGKSLKIDLGDGKIHEFKIDDKKRFEFNLDNGIRKIIVQGNKLVVFRQCDKKQGNIINLDEPGETQLKSTFTKRQVKKGLKLADKEHTAEENEATKKFEEDVTKAGKKAEELEELAKAEEKKEREKKDAEIIKKVIAAYRKGEAAYHENTLLRSKLSAEGHERFLKAMETEKAVEQDCCIATAEEVEKKTADTSNVDEEDIEFVPDDFEEEEEERYGMR
jgi:hypothetical protein